MRPIACSLGALLSSATAALATPILQFDLNGFTSQARDGGGAASAFGGVTHTGSVAFSLGTGVLNGIFINSANAGFSGFSLTGISGQINLSSGTVTGGSLTISINNGDSYTCSIVANSGTVKTSVIPPGGGFTIEALTSNGFFNDSMFGNVDVSTWFNSQGLQGLTGALLEFNFAPNAAGTAYSDMDVFVVAPLPPAFIGGLACIGGLAVYRRHRRAR
jgi:hypothetical protein